MIDAYVIQLIHGLVYGMLLFLVASGFTLVFGMMNVLNLAHAAFYMLGAYFAYTISIHLNSFWLSFLISPLTIGIIGVLIERVILRRAHKLGHHAEFLLTYGLFAIFCQLVIINWGSAPLPVPIPDLFAGNISFRGISYPIYRLFILGFSFLVLIGMVLMLIRTRTGMIIRAAVSDPDMVEALGTNVPFLFAAVFGGGAALAGLAGVIAAPFLSAYPAMGMEMLLDCFVIVVIGGFGSLLGASIASLMIGELHSFGILWVPRFAMVFQFLLMVIVLIIRPTGLFGEKE